MMKPCSEVLSGWGNWPRQRCFTFYPESRDDLRQALLSGTQPSYIARGLGRSYGDSALNRESGVLMQRRFNRFLAFDEATGILECEAGVSLAEIIECFLPRGWFLAVTPGTKFVTVGGAIAADIHGKNHHRVGSFGRFVRGIGLLLADGSEVTCSPEQYPDVFWATVGGMGLTGCILTARIQLVPVTTAFVRVLYRRTRNLDDAMALFSAEDDRFDYSVAWVDCMARGAQLGRTITMLADSAAIGDLPADSRQTPLTLPKRFAAKIPFNCPSALIAPWSVRLFNSLYYATHDNSIKTVDFDSFFCPLDRFPYWNRLYGRRGFVQYQAWFPTETAHNGLIALLERMTRSRQSSFLAVLKRSGPADDGLLTYLRPGYTLSVDFPNTAELPEISSDLDRILIRFGGAVYLAKDATTTAECIREMYPRLTKFRSLKAGIDPECRFQSSQAQRLGLI